jgi:methyltransferase
MNWPYVIMVFVTAQRLAELVIDRRNTARLLAAGAFEVGAAHYPWIVAMHVAWLATLWATVGQREIVIPLLATYAVLQVFRAWVLLTLGRRWTTRIIVTPNAPLVATGPFRFLRHPNYAVVIAEIAVLPLMFGLWWVALIFTLLNAALLSIRIRIENRALHGGQGAASA